MKFKYKAYILAEINFNTQKYCSNGGNGDSKCKEGAGGEFGGWITVKIITRGGDTRGSSRAPSSSDFSLSVTTGCDVREDGV